MVRSRVRQIRLRRENLRDLDRGDRRRLWLARVLTNPPEEIVIQVSGSEANIANNSSQFF